MQVEMVMEGEKNMGSLTSKKKGSMGWLVFWVIVFWPVAIVYAIIRSW